MSRSAHDFVRNGVKEKLKQGELVVSMAVKLVRSIEIAQIARTAGFDTLYIDLEHSSFSLDTTSQICMASMAVGVTPLVRVASIDPAHIGRVLDGGAMGIIAPHVQTKEDAERIVRAAKFAPCGDRSFTGSLPHLQYRTFPTAEVYEAMNEATMVIIMIESSQGLESAEAIAAVEGVDMLFIGTNDLCASLGIPGQLDHPSIQEAYSRTLAACQKHGKHLGIGGLGGKPEMVSSLIERGARYFSTGTDISFLLASASAKAKQMRSR
ncbi:aldolase [Alcaligenaceae bacterium]|nr:aldolase [Alcaligenaceae bacterium]